MSIKDTLRKVFPGSPGTPVSKQPDPGQGFDIDPLKETEDGEASVAMVVCDSDGEVKRVDVYAIPRSIFDNLPEWETAESLNQICQAYRCITVDTHCIIEER